MRTHTTIGNIYCIRINEREKCIFQYIAKDKSLVYFDVIRVFSRLYPSDYTPDLEAILSDNVRCYLHTPVKLGEQIGCWEKIGYCKDIGSLGSIVFRTSGDYANSKPGIKNISHKWTVWYLSEEPYFYGKLPKKYYTADIGLGFSPRMVVHILSGGDLDYPVY